jgi:23S rRNA (guanosine2251-2'-O)-methyltransferase
VKEWIVGRNPVYETLRARRRHVFQLLLADGIQKQERIDIILSLAKKNKLPIETVPRPRLDSLGEHHQGIALEVSGYSYANLEDIFLLAASRQEPLFILILDIVQNPQNLGTLLRTAEAVGVHGVLMPLRRTAEITPAVVASSSGACEHLLIAQSNLAQSINRLKENNVWVVGLEGSPEARLPQEIRLDGPLALVVGNEGEGMRLLVRKSCDMLMRLPMHGKIESLNAAVAGSIALYLALQARIKS